MIEEHLSFEPLSSLPCQVRAFEDNVPFLTIAHATELLDEIRFKMSTPYGQWQFVRVERHPHHQVARALIVPQTFTHSGHLQASSLEVV